MKSHHPTILAALLGILALGATTVIAAPGGKVDVCHPAGKSGNVLTLNINANALQAHLNHGDWLPMTWFADADGDGFGDANAPVTGCVQPEGTVEDDEDCNDADATVNPDAEEICGDGIDNDCLDGDEACVGCVDILLHCNAGSSVLETVCGGGVQTLAPYTASNISYVIFDTDVSGVVLHHCDGVRQMVITGDTNMCALPGGCCSYGRWNDEVCAVELF